jgi:beta-glucosidase
MGGRHDATDIGITDVGDTDIDELLGWMTLEEKCAQLGGAWFSGLVAGGELSTDRMADVLAHGIGQVTRIAAESGQGPEATADWHNAIQRFLVEETRLGIPAIVHEEAVAGFCARAATQFPHAIGLASTWDPDLVEAVAGVAGRQLRSVGARLALAPVLDVARDPRWGRLEETYGEDPELAARMGVAFVRGMQAQGVACAAKHFLGYGVPDAGFNHGEVSIGPRRLRDVFAAPFRAAIAEAGLAGVMNAYNEVDGLPCAGSPEILTDLLRGELGFDGTVVADYFAVDRLQDFHRVARDREESARLALVAGLDVELPALDRYRTLPDQVRRGLIDEELIDRACRRVLRQKVELGLLDDPYVDADAAAASFDTAEDRALARRAAARSIVLLTNDGVLPLSPGRRIAVVGPSADDPRLLLGDYSFPAHLEIVAEMGALLPTHGGIGGELPPQNPTVTPRAALAARVELVDDVGSADVAVVCVGGRSGLTRQDTSGELRDASDLRLPADQLALVERVAASGTPTVVVVIGGRAHSLSEVVPLAGALVMAWLPGEEGGSGLADVLCGDVDAGGRLPVSLLRTVGQVGVHGGHHHGGGHSEFYGPYVDGPETPLFAFGHGLSYTTWSYEAVDVDAGTTLDDITVDVAVRNTGDRLGEEVVQVYARDEQASVGVPARRLVAFRRVTADPGQVVHLAFTIPAGRLGFHGADLRFRVEPGDVTILVGNHESSVTIGGEIVHPDPGAVPPATSAVAPADCGLASSGVGGPGRSGRGEAAWSSAASEPGDGDPGGQ